jgi:hypothetical protein
MVKDMDQITVFLMQIPVFPATVVEEAVFSQLYVFGFFLSKVRWV